MVMSSKKNSDFDEAVETMQQPLAAIAQLEVQGKIALT